MRFVISIAAMLSAAPALAQQSPSTPLEQALSAKLMTEINNGLSCAVSAVVMQKQLADAQARVKELEQDKK